MPEVSTPFRRRGGLVGISRAALLSAAGDDRIAVSRGVVVQPEASSGNHWEVDGGDVLVEVELVPTGEEVTCSINTAFGGGAAGGAFGMFAIPPVGAEVPVMLIYEQPGKGGLIVGGVIIGGMAGGAVPGNLAADRVIIVVPSGMEVLVQSDGGTPKTLATLEDLQDLRDWAAAHTHTEVVAPGSPPTLGTTTPPATTPGTPDIPPTPSGTSVLKGE